MELENGKIRDVKFKTLRIRNFLAYKDLTLHFDKTGAYHVWGENNTGKSAFMQVISVLVNNISNQQYKTFLRDDCSTFIIDGEMWDGNTITLSRGASDYYEWTIDGNSGRLNKTQGKVPEIVRDYFNFYIDYEKTKYCLNLRLARETLLFVDTTAGENAYLLQKALGTEDILLAMKLGESKRKESKKEIKTIEELKEKDKEKLEVIETEYNQKTEVLEDVQKLYAVINEEYDEISEIEEIVLLGKELAETEQTIEDLKNQMGYFDLNELKTLAKDVELLHQARESVIHSIKYKKEAKKLNEKLTPDETLSEMAQLIEELKELEIMQQKEAEYMKSQKEYELAKEKYDEIYTILNEIQDLVEPLKLMHKGLSEIQEFAKYSKLQKTAQENYIQADKEWMDYMRENSFCPLVAKSFDKKCPFHVEVTL